MFEVVVGESPAVLADLACPAVAPALADLDPGVVSDAVLVDAIMAAERLASFAAARQAELVAELASRR
ncbi:MAG TPA: hypothetical protein VKG85_11435, partial [Actinomycetes bacterium]|nr:hypothetical protein [Actinomycetes bacterium]